MCKAVKSPSSTCRGMIMYSRVGARGSSRLTTSKPSFEMVATLRYLLTSLMFVSFFEGRVPCCRCARVRRKSGHSACVVNQAVRLVNGRCLVPLSMSWVDVCLTTDSWVSFVNAQTWQASSSRGAALRLEKSEGSIAEPDTCHTKAWYRLTVDRNVDTRGLVENSPRQSFSYAWMHGLLSVSMQAL